jgi:hypothetical protein
MSGQQVKMDIIIFDIGGGNIVATYDNKRFTARNLRKRSWTCARRKPLEF